MSGTVDSLSVENTMQAGTVQSTAGTNLDSHVSRHNPGGSDPIATSAPSNQTPDQTNAVGSATSLARADHVHNIPTASAVGLDVNSTNSQGSNASFARSNHTHAITSGAATTQTPDQTNAAGSAASFAKSDHTHNIPTASAVGLDTTSTNTQGSNSSFARSNHTHAIASGAPSTQTPDQANAAGTSANFAKADHTHNIPTASPQNTGAANSQGSASSFARSDHVHNTFPVFEANSASTDTNQTTTAGFTNGLTLNANGLAGGNYKIEWYYEWGFNDTAADFLARVQVDGGANIMDHRENPADSGGVGPGVTDQRMPSSGFAIVALTAGNHVVTLDYGSGNGALSTLWRAKLTLRRWS